VGQPLDPIRRRRDRTLGGFKTVWLSAAGWSALAGAGLAVGAIGVVAGAAPAVGLPAGMAGVWVAALVADHVRWRNSTIRLGRDFLDQATGDAVVAELKQMGIDAEYLEYVFDDEDGVEIERSIVSRNADAEKVAAVLDARR
jgi:hypothetical protein